MKPNGAGTLNRVSRRGFLQAAGAAAALSSCGGRRIEGTIVGASHARGHLLRGDLPPKAGGRVRTTVAILGGGIAGLSAAWKLRRSGLDDFLLLELEAEAGGNSRSGSGPITAYPWGAHYVPVPSRESTAVRELFTELGIIVGTDAAGAPVYDERYLCHAPQERLFVSGRWQDGLFPHFGARPADLAELEAFRARMDAFRRRRDMRDRRAFAIPVAASSDDAELVELDRISMLEYLRREGFQSQRLKWFVEYAMRDDYGSTLADTSAWAGVHYFAAREHENSEVVTWPEGNGWIVRRLADPLGDRLRPNSLVTDVREDGRGVLVDVLGEEPFQVVARRAIAAFPRFVAGRALASYRANPPPWLAQFTYAPWMTANLSVDRLPDEPAWDNVLYQSPSLGYVVATHQSLSRLAGPSVLTYYRPFAGENPGEARRRMLQRSWSDWLGEILRDLEGAHPDLAALLSRCDVMLWGHAMIRPTPGLIWGQARRLAADPLGPMLFANSDMSGLSIFEEAQYQGVRAAEQVLLDLGIRFTSSLGPLGGR